MLLPLLRCRDYRKCDILRSVPVESGRGTLMELINFDHISANPLLPEVKEAMIEAINSDFHNPSSQHRAGEQAAEAIEQARRSVAKLINAAAPKEIVFTSGGTESINHAIKGAALANAEKGKHIITSNIEHNAVIRSLRRLKSTGFRVTSLPVDKTGRVNPAGRCRGHYGRHHSGFNYAQQQRNRHDSADRGNCTDHPP